MSTHQAAVDQMTTTRPTVVFHFSINKTSTNVRPQIARFIEDNLVNRLTYTNKYKELWRSESPEVNQISPFKSNSQDLWENREEKYRTHKVNKMCWCDSTEETNSIHCSRCDELFHFSCEALTSLPEIETFFCSQCENNFSNLTTYKSDGPDLLNKDLLSNLYVVEKILDHRITNYGILFLIKWLGYSGKEVTWEPENHLTGCQELLDRYKRQNNLEISTMGAPWVQDMSLITRLKCLQILSKLQVFSAKYARQSRREKLFVGCYNENSFKTDEICILPFKEHIFVILYFKRLNIGFISDDGNNYMMSRSVRFTLHKYLDFNLFGVYFTDHASLRMNVRAATAIAITFWKSYHSSTVPSTINASKTTLKQIKGLN